MIFMLEKRLKHSFYIALAIRIISSTIAHPFRTNEKCSIFFSFFLICKSCGFDFAPLELMKINILFAVICTENPSTGMHSNDGEFTKSRVPNIKKKNIRKKLAFSLQLVFCDVHRMLSAPKVNFDKQMCVHCDRVVRS